MSPEDIKALYRFVLVVEERWEIVGNEVWTTNVAGTNRMIYYWSQRLRPYIVKRK